MLIGDAHQTGCRDASWQTDGPPRLRPKIILLGHGTPPTSQSADMRLERAMRGIRKDKRGEMPGKKRPADGDVLRDMVRAIVGEDLRS